MADLIRAATLEQQNLLSMLKKLGHSELSKLNIIDFEEFVKPEFKSLISISRKFGANKEVKIEVVVDGGVDINYQSIFDEVNSGEYFIESSNFTDGFDLFPDGTVAVMHPENFDDD